MKTQYQPDLLETPKPENTSLPIIIELRGLGPVPSFKNKKKIRAWMDRATRREEVRNGKTWILKESIRIRSLLYLEPEIQDWMDRATSLIESRLRSAIPISIEKIRMGASPRLRIATLLPLDDCWTSFREVIIKNELCGPGQEGATIKIERL